MGNQNSRSSNNKDDTAVRNVRSPRTTRPRRTATTTANPIPVRRSLTLINEEYEHVEDLQRLAHSTRAVVEKRRRRMDGALVVCKWHRAATFRAAEVTIPREQLDRHPNIAVPIEFLHTGRHVCLVSEFAAGGDLFEGVLHERLCNTPLETAHAALQILDGLCHMHEKFVYHGDLKPENCLLYTSPSPRDRG